VRLSCREDGVVKVAWDALKTEVAVIAPAFTRVDQP